MDRNQARIVRLRECLRYAEKTNPFVSLYFDEVEWPDGRRGYYNRIVEGTGAPGVAILPIHTHGIGLIHIDRYAVNRRLWEIPRGFGESTDPGWDPSGCRRHSG